MLPLAGSHYSQMIWRDTKKLGCALGEGANADYLVCRYFPAGNIFGKVPLELEEESIATVGTQVVTAAQ